MIAETTAHLEGSVEPPARKLGGVKAVGILGILAGIALIVAGIVVWIMVSSALQAEGIPIPGAEGALTSVVSFGVPALAIATGILSIMFGWALHRLASAPVIVRPATVV